MWLPGQVLPAPWETNLAFPVEFTLSSSDIGAQKPGTSCSTPRRAATGTLRLIICSATTRICTPVCCHILRSTCKALRGVEIEGDHDDACGLPDEGFRPELTRIGAVSHSNCPNLPKSRPVMQEASSRTVTNYPPPWQLGNPYLRCDLGAGQDCKRCNNSHV
jgi:hypothetical protein